MERNIFDTLCESIKEKNSHICLSLNPEYLRLPKKFQVSGLEDSSNPLEKIAEKLLEFNKAIITEVYDIIPVIKVNPSYYEIYGSYGVRALIETIKYAKKVGIIVIEDLNLSAIEGNAVNYAKAHLGKVQIVKDREVSVFDSDIITINPFLGEAGIKSFVDEAKKHNKGLIVTLKTENPESAVIQDMMVDVGGDIAFVFELIAELIEHNNEDTIGENGFGLIGALVDITLEEYSASIFDIMQSSFFLIPESYDKASNKKKIISDIVMSLFREDSTGVVVNTQELIYAYDAVKKDTQKKKPPFQKAVRKALISMKKAINKELKIEFGEAELF